MRTARGTLPDRVLFGLLVLAAGLPGCFDALTLPTCAHPAECPAGYVACEAGHCLLGSARCDGAGAVPGDGCCAVGPGDRSQDADCVGFTVSLGEAGVRGPVVDPVDGAALVTTVDEAEPPSTGTWIWLSRMARDGGRLWRVPVGEGSSAHLAPPVVTVDGVWAAFGQGLRRFDRSGQERDLVADAPWPGRLAVDGQGRLAWWSAARRALVVRGGAPGSLEHVVPLEGEGADVVGPVVATGAAHVVLAVGPTLRRFASHDGSPAGGAELDGPALDLLVTAGWLFVLEGPARLGAFVLGAETLPRAWGGSIPLPAEALGRLAVDEAGRLLLPAAGGRLLVVDDPRAGGEVVEVRTPWEGDAGLLLLADGWLVQASGSNVAAARLAGPGEPGGLREAWRNRLATPPAGWLQADPEGHVLVLDELGRLVRLVSGAPGPARAGWPTAGGATTGGGREVDVAPTSTEER